MNRAEEKDADGCFGIESAGAITELGAMQTIADALNPLDDGSRKRVFHWAHDFFNIDEGRVEAAPSSSMTLEDPMLNSGSRFETFGELYSAVDPLTQEDKALTAAYWLQVVLDNESWQSADVQKELRELGYPLTNVADSLSSAVGKRPQRVIQLKKSGSSRQARKTFKLSDAGKRYIEERLNHNAASES